MRDSFMEFSQNEGKASAWSLEENLALSDSSEGFNEFEPGRFALLGANVVEPTHGKLDHDFDRLFQLTVLLRQQGEVGVQQGEVFSFIA